MCRTIVKEVEDTNIPVHNLRSVTEKHGIIFTRKNIKYQNEKQLISPAAEVTIFDELDTGKKLW